MAVNVKASASVTLSTIRDISSVTWYYLLQASTAAAPAKPTASPPGGSWTDSEPSYTGGDTKSLYVTERTVYTDGTFEYSTPHLSSSYEASKAAWTLANNASGTAAKALEQSIEYITGTQTAATGAWTGKTADAALKTGKTIAYKLPYAGSGNATLNLTLSGGGTTGAKEVYWNTTRVTTHYPAGSVIKLTYDGSVWRADNYNSDTVNRTRLQNVIIAAEAITASHVIVGTSAGYRDIAAGVAFDITYPVLWAGTTIAKGATSGTRDNNYLQINGVNLATSKSGWTGTNGSTVYIVGSLVGNTFTVDSAVFTTAVPTSADGKFYIPIGLMYSTTQCYFNSSNRLYAYLNGKFQAVDMAAKGLADTAQSTANNAKKVATNYLAYDSNGLIVYDGYNGEKLPKTVTSYNVFISSETNDASVKIRSGQTVLNKINKSGMIVYGDGKQIASFGKEITLGQPDKSRLVQTDSGLSGRNMNGEEYFFIGQSKGTETTGYLYSVCEFYSMAEETNENFFFDDDYIVFKPENTVVEAIMLEYAGLGDSTITGGVSGNDLILNKETNEIRAKMWDDFSGKGYHFWISYFTKDTLGLPHFTLGTRASARLGSFSMAAGKENSAVDELSYAFGQGLYADTGQFVIGSYNKTDRLDESVFMIGNGYKDLEEEPVFEVTLTYTSLPYTKTITTSLNLFDYILGCVYLEGDGKDYELQNNNGVWQLKIWNTENSREWLNTEMEFSFYREAEFRSNALTIDMWGNIDVQSRPDNCSWYQQRDYAILRRTGLIEDTAMYPFIDAKTQSGDWAMSTYGENLWFSYVTNTNYKNYTNTQSAYFRMNSNGSFAPSGKYMSGTNALFAQATMSADNKSIAKSSTSSITFSIAKSGYTPIAIRGFDIDNATSSGANVGSCVVLAAKIKDSSTAEFQIRNNATSAAKLKLWLYVTYIATAAL